MDVEVSDVKIFISDEDGNKKEIEGVNGTLTLGQVVYDTEEVKPLRSYEGEMTMHPGPGYGRFMRRLKRQLESPVEKNRRKNGSKRDFEEFIKNKRK